MRLSAKPSANLKYLANEILLSVGMGMDATLSANHNLARQVAARVAATDLRSLENTFRIVKTVLGKVEGRERIDDNNAVVMAAVFSALTIAPDSDGRRPGVLDKHTLDVILVTMHVMRHARVIEPPMLSRPDAIFRAVTEVATQLRISRIPRFGGWETDYVDNRAKDADYFAGKTGEMFALFVGMDMQPNGGIKSVADAYKELLESGRLRTAPAIALVDIEAFMKRDHAAIKRGIERNVPLPLPKRDAIAAGPAAAVQGTSVKAESPEGMKLGEVHAQAAPIGQMPVPRHTYRQNVEKAKPLQRKTTAADIRRRTEIVFHHLTGNYRDEEDHATRVTYVLFDYLDPGMTEPMQLRFPFGDMSAIRLIAAIARAEMRGKGPYQMKFALERIGGEEILTAYG